MKTNKYKVKKAGKPNSIHFLISASGIICGPIWGSYPVWRSFAALYDTRLTVVTKQQKQQQQQHNISVYKGSENIFFVRSNLYSYEKSVLHP